MPRQRFRPVRRRRRTRIMRVPKLLMPSTKLVKLSAVDYINHVHTAGAIAVTGLQQNSIDDPFKSAGSGQPLGYDQLKALYKKAIVVSSKVYAQIHNNTSTAIMVGITPMPPNTATTSLTTYEHYMETPRTKNRLLSPDVDRVNLSHQISTKKLLSLTNLKDNKDKLEIDLDTETPAPQVSAWHIWSQPQDQTTETTGTAVQWTVTMTYIVLLYDPIIPARSVET